ncbi:hypothetical protein MKZ38_006416 [Zalerion maritima]|uniref:Uncharacterized protein n=1 Tax=Zalerion maritima TaxID=339359 RepID=A0AAD5RIX8_9PEZI|nr:hypothetical protein MKZ38_006416 [Zalerion maritima]
MSTIGMMVLSFYIGYMQGRTARERKIGEQEAKPAYKMQKLNKARGEEKLRSTKVIEEDKQTRLKLNPDSTKGQGEIIDLCGMTMAGEQSSRSSSSIRPRSEVLRAQTRRRSVGCHGEEGDIVGPYERVTSTYFSLDDWAGVGSWAVFANERDQSRRAEVFY